MLLGCGGKDGAGQPSGVPAKSPKVVVMTAITQPMTDYDEFVGRTEAFESVEVRSRVSGFLQSIDFADGAFVEKDQLLGKIEPDQYRAIHDQSLAMVELQKTKFELAMSVLARSKKLKEGSAISQEEFEENAASVTAAEAEIQVAKADAARTALDLKYTELKAPISGRIDRALVSAGNVVTGGLGSGTLLTTIVNDSPIYAYFNVDEASILRYIRKDKAKPKRESETKEGEGSDTEGSDNEGSDTENAMALRELKIPVELQLKDETDYPHIGTLDFLENRLDERTGTVQLRGIFENDNHLIREGLFVRVRIPVSEPYEAVMIPEAAIGTDQTEKFAFVIGDDNVAERRVLTMGPMIDQPSGGSLRVIREGITAGESVVVKGVQRVQPGMKVDPQPAETPTQPAASTQQTKAAEPTGAEQ